MRDSERGKASLGSRVSNQESRKEVDNAKEGGSTGIAASQSTEKLDRAATANLKKRTEVRRD